MSNSDANRCLATLIFINLNKTRHLFHVFRTVAFGNDGFNGFIEGIKKFFTEDIPAAFGALLQFFEDLPYNIGYAIGYVLQTLENWRQDIINWITTKVVIHVIIS